MDLSKFSHCVKLIFIFLISNANDGWYNIKQIKILNLNANVTKIKIYWTKIIALLIKDVLLIKILINQK